MRTLLLASTAIATLTATPPSYAAPKFNLGTSVRGVIAYQDHADPSQFHYIPLAAETPLDRVKTLSVQHFGIGRSYFVQQADGDVTSRTGAIVSGTVVIDINDAQRTAIISQIKNDFPTVSNPKLLPVAMSDVSIDSTMLDKSLTFGDGLEVKLPSKNLQIGSEFAFSAGSLNSGFGHLAAVKQAGTDITANPNFGLNVTGKVEFVGEPWTAKIHCDLAKVWSQTRTKASVSGNIGWFRLGKADYSKVNQELKDSGACTFDMTEGSLSNEKYGREMLEMTKTIFEATNKLATEGDGFFKFDNNMPQADQPASGGSDGGFNLFGWSVSINGGYSSAYFKQEKTWDTTVSYTGRFKWDVPISTVLALKCGTDTKKYFQDLNDSSDPCVTQKKADILRDRLQKEGAAKLKKREELEIRRSKGEINDEAFNKLWAYYKSISLSEFASNLMNIRVESKSLAPADFKIERALVLGLTPDVEDKIEQSILSGQSSK